MGKGPKQKKEKVVKVKEVKKSEAKGRYEISQLIAGSWEVQHVVNNAKGRKAVMIGLGGYNDVKKNVLNNLKPLIRVRAVA